MIGVFVRGLSMRDVEDLCETTGLGKLSKSTASRMCEELKERFEAFKRRDLYEIPHDAYQTRRLDRRPDCRGRCGGRSQRADLVMFGFISGVVPPPTRLVAAVARGQRTRVRVSFHRTDDVTVTV